MSYTTPTRFCTVVNYEEAMRYLVQDDQVLTADLLKQVVGVEAGTGEWAPETTVAEQVVALAAHAELVRQLVNTSNLIDGYLRTAGVTLPLPLGNANAGTLDDCCLAIARDELASDSDMSTDQIVKRAERWRAYLKDVAAKRATLTLPEGGGDVVTTSSVRTGQAKSGFDWKSHSLGHGGWTE